MIGKSINGLLRSMMRVTSVGPWHIGYKVSESDTFGGWPVISLRSQINHHSNPIIESRIVYGDPFAFDQTQVIARRLLWDHAEIRSAIAEQGIYYRINPNITFHLLPSQLLREWIGTLSGITMITNGTKWATPPETSRHFRLCIDYAWQSTEHGWALDDDNLHALNTAWELVWDSIMDQSTATNEITKFANLVESWHIDLSSDSLSYG